MAVPSITSLDKPEGTPSGGYVVTIQGTDFATQGTMAPGVLQAIPDSVRVTLRNTQFNLTVPIEKINLISETAITFVMPKVILITHDGPGSDMPFDVTVENLDSNGDPIPGEATTAANAFTIKRRCIDGVRLGKIASLVQFLVVLMRSEIHWNTSTVVHTEYDRDTSTPRAEAVKLPHITILGPDITKSEAGYQDLSRVVAQDGDEYSSVEAPVYYDVAFSLVMVADTNAVIYNLQGAALDFFTQNHTISVPDDLRDPNGPATDMAMQLTFGPSVEQITSQYPSNIRVARAEFTVFGLPCYEEDIDGCPTPVDFGFTVSEDGTEILPIDNRCLAALLEAEAGSNP